MWNKLERAKLDEQYGCGYTIYGWDGDLLAFESRNNDKRERLTHYFFEPGSFVPVAQAVEQRSIQLVAEPVYEGAYDIDHDPVWQHKPTPINFNALAWYQCDHLGTPMELTDEHGDIAWSGVYKVWGLAKEQRSETAKRADIRNPLRFQGQYFDVETGLHYNRYRYYDPQVGRFIGKDPIGFAGGLNVYAYAPNPAGWVDPLGLSFAEAAANAALSAGKKSGAAAELRVGNQVFTGISGESAPHNPKVTGALMGTPGANRANWHGGCAEIVCLDKALNAGVDPAGGTSRAVNIGISGSGHNTPKPACSSCRDIQKYFGVNI
ncbi:RHS repeat-associated core domain-containing protein [Pseudomonas sp. IT-196MI5]